MLIDHKRFTASISHFTTSILDGGSQSGRLALEVVPGRFRPLFENQNPINSVNSILDKTKIRFFSLPDKQLMEKRCPQFCFRCYVCA